MSHWGCSLGGKSPRHTTDDDSPDLDSDDPLLLTDLSSQPGSPMGPARGRRPDNDLRRAAAKNKQTTSERERDVLKTQSGARSLGMALPWPLNGATTAKKRMHPYLAALTSDPRRVAPSAPVRVKDRTQSGVYDAEDEDRDTEPTPKARKTTNPFSVMKNIKAASDASPAASRSVLPFHGELDNAKARPAASQQPRPHPTTGMKPFKSAPAPASPKLAPFPLQHLIDANSNSSMSPKPAPLPLASKQGNTSARDPRTLAASTVAKKSIAHKVLASKSAFVTSRPELLSINIAPFPMHSPTTASSSTSAKPKSSNSEAGVRPFPVKLPSMKRPAAEGTGSDRAPKRRKRVQEAPELRPKITKSAGSPESTPRARLSGDGSSATRSSWTGAS